MPVSEKMLIATFKYGKIKLTYRTAIIKTQCTGHPPKRSMLCKVEILMVADQQIKIIKTQAYK
jgi:hypothetical protein